MTAPGAEKAIRSVIHWGQREQWHGVRDEIIEVHIEGACDQLDIDPDQLADEIGDEAYISAMMCMVEDFLSCRLGPDGVSVIDDYLRRRGWKKGAPVKRYLQALSDSVMSLYEVVAMSPGSHLTVRDLLRPGEPLRVEDGLLSESAVLWDRVGLRVLEVNGKNYPSGAVLWFSFDAADTVLRTVQRATKRLQRELRKAARQGDEVELLPREAFMDVTLSVAAQIFTRVWLIDTVESLREASLSLSNLDGEDLFFTKVRFPVEGATEDIEQKLDAAPSLDREAKAEARWTWFRREAAAEPRAAVTSDGEPSRQGPGDGLGTVMGIVRLVDRDVVLYAFPGERAERGTALIGETLDGLVGAPRTTVVTPEQVLRGHDEAADGAETSSEAAALAPGDKAAVVREVLHEHYGQSLDDPVEVLDHQSPRQAVRRKAGRTRVATWLKFMENQELHRAGLEGDSPYDFGWMWEELGVAHLRQ